MKASANEVAQATINIRKAQAQDAANDAAKEAAKKKLEEAEANAKRLREIEVSELKTIGIEYATHTEFIKSELDKRGAYDLLKLQEQKARRDKDAKDAMAMEKQKTDTKLKLETMGFNAAKGLTEAFFAIELAGARGNEAEQLKIKKKAFEVDKAFSLVKAGNDTYSAALSAYAGTPGGPLIKGIAAGLATAYGLSQVLKIAASQFNGGQASAPTQTAPTADVNIPTMPTPQTRQGSTLLDDFGNPISGQQRDEQVIRAYLLDKEVEGKMKNLKRIEEQSKF